MGGNSKVAIAFASILTVAFPRMAFAASNDICGNATILNDLKSRISGPEIARLVPDHTAVSKALGIAIIEQRSDETGLRVRCAASASVSHLALQTSKMKLSARDKSAYMIIEGLEDNEGSVAALLYLVTLSSNRQSYKLDILNPDDNEIAIGIVQARLKRIFLPPDPPKVSGGVSQ